MPQNELYILLVLGGLFILLGIGAYFWGKSEEKNYYNAISRRPDTREYLEHWPYRPQFEALKIGGRISIAVGTIIVLIGGGIWLWS